MRQENARVQRAAEHEATGILPEEIVVARSSVILNHNVSMLLAKGLPNPLIDGKSLRGVGSRWLRQRAGV